MEHCNDLTYSVINLPEFSQFPSIVTGLVDIMADIFRSCSNKSYVGILLDIGILSVYHDCIRLIRLQPSLSSLIMPSRLIKLVTRWVLTFVLTACFELVATTGNKQCEHNLHGDTLSRICYNLHVYIPGKPRKTVNYHFLTSLTRPTDSHLTSCSNKSGIVCT
jgi:hypothetical protein